MPRLVHAIIVTAAAGAIVAALLHVAGVTRASDPALSVLLVTLAMSIVCAAHLLLVGRRR